MSLNYYGRNMRPYSWLFNETSKPTGTIGSLPSFPAKGVRVQAYPYVLEALWSTMNAEQSILAFQNLELSTSTNAVPMVGLNGGVIVGNEPSNCPLHAYKNKYPAMFGTIGTTISPNTFSHTVMHVDTVVSGVRSVTFAVWAGRARTYPEEDSLIYQRTLTVTQDIKSFDVKFTNYCYADSSYASNSPGIPGSFVYYGPKMPKRADQNKFENCFHVIVTYADDTTHDFKWTDSEFGSDASGLYWQDGWGPSDLLFFPIVWMDYLDDAKVKNDAYFEAVQALDKLDADMTRSMLVDLDSTVDGVEDDLGSLDERVTALENSSSSDAGSDLLYIRG